MGIQFSGLPGGDHSHHVDKNGNVELNFDDPEVQRVLRRRLDDLLNYDLAEPKSGKSCKP